MVFELDQAQLEREWVLPVLNNFLTKHGEKSIALWNEVLFDIVISYNIIKTPDSEDVLFGGYGWAPNSWGGPLRTLAILYGLPVDAGAIIHSRMLKTEFSNLSDAKLKGYNFPDSVVELFESSELSISNLSITNEEMEWAMATEIPQRVMDVINDLRHLQVEVSERVAQRMAISIFD
ncbi:hypothetical protein LWE61_09075 [Sphingobium sufflavum]|uniref:hypothetical protein n=1 Tax=Sphingobium sufflavum TaxID=1129547 RepID=UPI001F2B31B9|nr:hypothetical protein [Sphingobium sufflavum]MCE7796711.1 hypothetical protein [Sphingobium sufflavum]